MALITRFTIIKIKDTETIHKNYFAFLQKTITVPTEYGLLVLFVGAV